MRSVPDVLPLRVADQMPVDRIAGESHVLAHSIEFDALDKHLASDHRHDVPAVEGLFRVGRSLEFDIARQHADFAAFIHVEGDLAEVHVVELLVERDRVSTGWPQWCAVPPAGDRNPSMRERSRRRRASQRRSGPGSRWRRLRLCWTAWSRCFSGPCKFRVPPMSRIPRSTRSVVPPTPLMSSPLTLSVRVMVALRV